MRGVEPGDATVADLVEAAAARHPDAVAVVTAHSSLTYAGLDAAANRLAHHLQALGVGPDARVGVCLGRSVDLAVALLAVLKAGGACVPLDPAYPEARLAHMLDDASPTAVLAAAPWTGRLPAGSPVPTVRLDADAGEWAGLPATPPARATGPGNLGYVIYTSGSAGGPKGVMLTHRGLVDHHRAAADLYGLAPGDRVAQFCSLGFDASIEEMFPTWAAGAAVVFRPDGLPVLGRPWLAWLRAARVTVLNLPTAYWHAWVRDLDGLDERVPAAIRLVVVGGERAGGSAYQAWRRVGGDRSRWVNAYGPAETTCMSTVWEGGALADGRDPPIGRPRAGATVVVVDDDLRRVPAGITGELLIGGAGLARGYLGDPALTAERFVDDKAGNRVYRTGDLVRARADGDLEFMGRTDDQVKVRGFRVEPAEVEAALAHHPGVAAAAVVGGDDRLVAYVVGDVTGADLREYLAVRLPPHLVPDAYLALDALPLTPNGKLDRAALPAPGTSGGPRPRRTAAEDRMAAIWARVLGADLAHLGPDDDFFDLGGHSLLATQVVAQVREEFGTDTALRAIFETPTLGGLAAVAAAEAEAGAGRQRFAPAGPRLVPARPREPGGLLPLSLAQEQMWDLEVAAAPPGLYNITALHRFDAWVDVALLRRALATVAERHEPLRTAFVPGGDGRPRQVVAADINIDLRVAEGGGDPTGRIAAQDALAFDLARPPLWRAGLFPLDGGGARLAVTLDHLVCDGTGAAIFMAELLAVLDRRPLPALEVQFADFAGWQRAHVTDDVLDRQLAWWAATLDGAPLGPAVAFDRLPAAPTRRVASAAVAIGPAARAGLEDVARATNSTVFTVAAAGVGALLGRHGGTADVVMSTTLSGRTRAEVEGLVGMFSGIGRLRADLAGDPPFAPLVGRVRERVLGMFEHQDVPFMRVRRSLWPDFPSGGAQLAAALPVEFQYFHVDDDVDLFFRGQLHPLSVTLLDDGVALSGTLSYKLDFYRPETVDRLARDLERLFLAVSRDPSLRLSQLPVSPPVRG